MRLGDSATALRCFQEALDAARAAGSLLDEGYTLSTMGDAYVQQGDDARAMETYERGLAVWRAVGGRRGEAGLVGEIGLLYARRGDHARALEMYRRALELTRATGFKGAEASTLLNRGASLSEVQDVLGHASPDTTKAIYAHYTPKVLRVAVEKYSATPAELVGDLEAEQEQRRRGP